MKNKSWIIILIMGIALTISIGYSVVLQQKNAEKERTVTTTSIIEMTATTATIKNTLKGTGVVEYKEAKEENIENNTAITEENEQSEREVTDFYITIHRVYQEVLGAMKKSILLIYRKTRRKQIDEKRNGSVFFYLGDDHRVL